MADGFFEKVNGSVFLIQNYVYLSHIKRKYTKNFQTKRVVCNFWNQVLHKKSIFAFTFFGKKKLGKHKNLPLRKRLYNFNFIIILNGKMHIIHLSYLNLYDKLFCAQKIFDAKVALIY